MHDCLELSSTTSSVVYSYTLQMNMHVNVHMAWWIWKIPMCLMCVCVCVWIPCFAYYFVKSLSGLEAWYYVTPLESEVFWWFITCSSGCCGVALWWNDYVLNEDFMNINVSFLNVIIINYNVEDTYVMYGFLTDHLHIAYVMIVGLGKTARFNYCS